MSKEFYIKDWLKAHPFWYVTSHMFIVPFIDIYASALDWKMEGKAAPTGLIFFFAVSYMNGIVLEIGRKIRVPQKESVGVNTYTAMLGTQKATLLWIFVLTLNCALSIAAALYAQESQAPWIIFGSLLLLFVIPGILFLFQPTERMSKWIEWSSILWTIAMYFSLGGIPMIHQLLSN
jgi:4-hydroxybenzoate polyprenyltransferase